MSAIGSVTVNHNEKFTINGVSADGQIGSVTTNSQANVSVSLSEATGEVGFIAVWSMIDETQTPYWDSISSSQETPGWTEITETQEANWEEVA